MNITEGNNIPMTRSARTTRRWLGGIVAVSAALAMAILPQTTAHAQSAEATMTSSLPVAQQKLPNNVLLFPANVSGGGEATAEMSPAAKATQEIVTEAVRKYLQRGGVNVVVYSNRLPSIQRAVNEGQGLKPEDAAKGPGDDPRLAQRFAEITGASEYIVVSVDDFAYDNESRRATFNLSVIRSATEGGSLGASAEKAVGDSPADVATSRQQGAAVARAAEQAAEKSVVNIYPQSAVMLYPPKVEATKKKKRSRLSYLIPALAVGFFLIAPR